jgi:hypothetical protein
VNRENQTLADLRKALRMAENHFGTFSLKRRRGYLRDGFQISTWINGSRRLGPWRFAISNLAKLAEWSLMPQSNWPVRLPGEAQGGR